MTAAKTDRYVSFTGIECEAQARALVARILAVLENPGAGNALWDRFRVRLADAEAKPEARFADTLLLLHAHVYYLHDLLAEHGTPDDVAALERLEEECC